MGQGVEDGVKRAKEAGKKGTRGRVKILMDAHMNATGFEAVYFTWMVQQLSKIPVASVEAKFSLSSNIPVQFQPQSLFSKEKNGPREY